MIRFSICFEEQELRAKSGGVYYDTPPRGGDAKQGKGNQLQSKETSGFEGDSNKLQKKSKRCRKIV